MACPHCSLTFLKQTTQHSLKLHAIMGQPCECKRGDREVFLFPTLFLPHFLLNYVSQFMSTAQYISINVCLEACPIICILGSVFTHCDDCFSICLLVWPFRKTIHSLELDSRFKEPRIFEPSPIYCIFAMYIVEERQRISAQYNCLPLQ